MGKTYRLPVDWGRVAAALKMRGLTMRQAAVSIGHGPCYFHDCARDAKKEGVLPWIHRRAVIALADKYRIDYDDIKPVDAGSKPTQAEEKQHRVMIPVDPDRLRVCLNGDSMRNAARVIGRSGAYFNTTFKSQKQRGVPYALDRESVHTLSAYYHFIPEDIMPRVQEQQAEQVEQMEIKTADVNVIYEEIGRAVAQAFWLLIKSKEGNI